MILKLFVDESQHSKQNNTLLFSYMSYNPKHIRSSSAKEGHIKNTIARYVRAYDR